MMFVSARTGKDPVAACRAILNGVAPDGGLYVPQKFPKLTADFFKKMATSSLAERMAGALSLFVDLSEEKLIEICEDALRDFGDALPLTMAEEGLYVLDLACGNTGRADDLSTRVFARLVSAARKKLGQSEVFVAAFAGSAACGKTVLDAFAGVEGTAAIAFVPADENLLAVRALNASASDKNVQAVGVKGENSKDELKNALSDDKFLSKVEQLSCKTLVADGANIGRVLPYIACFVSAYADLAADGEIDLGDKINFALPAGDLSAAIAGIYVKQMGLPIDRLVLAFNSNRTVIDLIADGEFKLPKKAFSTCAPEMDEILPANLERLVFELSDRDTARTAEAMEALENGEFLMGDTTESVAFDILVAGWADEDDIKDTANNFFDIDDVVFDPHTAATASVLDDYCNEAEDETPAVLFQTADPYVYATNTLKTLGVNEPDPLKAVAKLELLTALERPRCIEEALSSRDVNPDGLIPASWMSEALVAFMKQLK